jgi:hypothetical protein
MSRIILTTTTTALLLLLLAPPVYSFVVCRSSSSRPIELIRLRNQPDEWQGFNPLLVGGATTAASKILMRKTQMKDLTIEMMSNIDDDEKLQELMENAKDFMLEPLENDNAVLDLDSIYEAGMSRAQRYARYRETAEERISKASRSSLKKLLQSMMDYVLKYE